MRGLYHCLFVFCLEYLCIMRVKKQSVGLHEWTAICWVVFRFSDTDRL